VRLGAARNGTTSAPSGGSGPAGASSSTTRPATAAGRPAGRATTGPGEPDAGGDGDGDGGAGGFVGAPPAEPGALVALAKGAQAGNDAVGHAPRAPARAGQNWK
jgi:hypothetical protein